MKTRAYIGYGIGIVAIVGVLAGINEAIAQEKPDVVFDLKCNATHCLVDKQILVDLMEAHNAQVEEIRRLNKNCGFKADRNS